MNTHVVDEEAREIAREAKNMALVAQNQVNSHERECVIFRASSMKELREIKSILAYGTCALLAALCGLIGFLATHPPH